MTKRNIEPGFANPPEPRQTVMTKTTIHGDRDEVTVAFGDGSNDLKMSRRDFLRISAVAAATATMAGAACRNPVDYIQPYVDRPEEVRIGFPNEYATVSPIGSIFGPVRVFTRTGRPIFVGSNQKSSRFGCVGPREIASYVDLYDPDRMQFPARLWFDKKNESVAEKIAWSQLDESIIKYLNRLGPKARVAILQTTAPGLSQDKLFELIQESVPNLKRYIYEPLDFQTLRQATAQVYGRDILPQYRFDRAKTIVSFGADFIGTWLTPEEYSAQFIKNRNPNRPDEFNRLHVFEGNMTLTGMNADERYRVKTSLLPYVALGVAHGVTHKLGKQGLVPDTFSVDNVVKLTGLEKSVLTDVIDELVENKGHGLVVGGGLAGESKDGLGLEAAVMIINEVLGNVGETVVLDQPISHNRGGVAQLDDLIKAMNAGEVDLLIINKANPVYQLNDPQPFIDALKKVELVVSTSDRVDETATYAHYLATASHPFESWGDAVSYDGIYSVRQAIIQPLYSTRSFEESLIMWFGQSLAQQTIGPFINPPPLPADNRGGDVPTDPGPYYRFVKNYWEEVVYPASRALLPFKAFWTDALRQGFVEMPSATYTKEVRFNGGRVKALLPTSLPSATETNLKGFDDVEITLFETSGMGDGSQANNGHLQELPDPVSKMVWGSYVLVSPKRFMANKLKMGQYIEITVNGVEERFPAIFQPGLHDDVIAIPVGFGRTAVGEVGNEVGENAYRLTKRDGSRQLFAGIKADKIKILPHGEKPAQIHGGAVIDLDRRPIMSIASLEEYKESKTAGIHTHPPLPTFWKRYEYETKWGMAVDLNKCTNCGACVIACQEENNVPVVGVQGVRENREMHWLRMDRYYLLTSEKAKELETNPITNPMLEMYPEMGFHEFMDNPRTVWQPMMCVQCERAPCENVCPVAATSHSQDGLNMMTYNRCVGTRYCSNNCPYKVRRFNWFNYSEDRSEGLIARFLYPELKVHARLNVKGDLPMGMNPDVTVRGRGIMEKCTFCVQRIRRAKWRNMMEGRRDFRDGDIVTACEDVCSTDAIAFGNLADPESTVSKWSQDPRALDPLSELGVFSSVSYLTRVVNSKERYNHAHHGHAPKHAGEDEEHEHGSREHGSAHH